MGTWGSWTVRTTQRGRTRRTRRLRLRAPREARRGRGRRRRRREARRNGRRAKTRRRGWTSTSRRARRLALTTRTSGMLSHAACTRCPRRPWRGRGRRCGAYCARQRRGRRLAEARRAGGSDGWCGVQHGRRSRREGWRGGSERRRRREGAPLEAGYPCSPSRSRVSSRVWCAHRASPTTRDRLYAGSGRIEPRRARSRP
jgi:hypothetical protein